MIILECSRGPVCNICGEDSGWQSMSLYACWKRVYETRLRRLDQDTQDGLEQGDILKVSSNGRSYLLVQSVVFGSRSRSRLTTWKGKRQGRVDGIRHLLFICCLLAITQPRRPDLKIG